MDIRFRVHSEKPPVVEKTCRLWLEERLNGEACLCILNGVGTKQDIIIFRPNRPALLPGFTAEGAPIQQNQYNCLAVEFDVL